MSIYTRRGDAGDTGLADGSRTSKASARVEAYGALDEAGAAIGFARQAVKDPAVDSVLLFAQQRIFNCTSALATPTPDDSTPTVSADDVTFLESVIDRFQQASGGWRGFVLASGGEAVTRLHLARTITRRAERRVVELSSQALVQPEVLAFVNRLSDLLFAAANATAATDGSTAEDPWDRDARPPAF